MNSRLSDKRVVFKWQHEHGPSPDKCYRCNDKAYWKSRKENPEEEVVFMKLSNKH
jgi:hypothetical protein